MVDFINELIKEMKKCGINRIESRKQNDSLIKVKEGKHFNGCITGLFVHADNISKSIDIQSIMEKHNVSSIHSDIGQYSYIDVEENICTFYITMKDGTSNSNIIFIYRLKELIIDCGCEYIKSIDKDSIIKLEEDNKLLVKGFDIKFKEEKGNE